MDADSSENLSAQDDLDAIRDASKSLDAAVQAIIEKGGEVPWSEIANMAGITQEEAEKRWLWRWQLDVLGKFVSRRAAF